MSPDCFRQNCLCRVLIAIGFLGIIASGNAQSLPLPTYSYNKDTAVHRFKDAGSTACLLIVPTFRCMGSAADRNSNVLKFFDVDATLSYINQFKSIYNGASSSATVSADIGTLTFGSGWQLKVGSNIQAGPSTVVNVASGATPTLSSTSAAQATQNLLYGGTISAAAIVPLSFYGPDSSDAGGFGFSLDLVGREGVDIQNFSANTSSTVTNPPSHGSAQIEGYLQYNSINLIPGSTDQSQFAGAVFVGGSYGYNYMSYDYARDYGFANESNKIGQISLGILLNNVAKISASRAFGPSQVYIDSATPIPMGATVAPSTKVNNFKAWSFGITYQSPPPTK